MSALGAMTRTRQHIRGLTAYGLGPMLGLATAPLLARALGPEGRGELATLVQPTTMAAYIAAMGAPLAATFFISQGRSPSLTLRRCLTLVAVSASLTYALMLGYAGHLSSHTNIPFWMFALVWLFVPLTAGLQTLRGAWQGLGAWKRLDYDRILGATARALGIVALILLGFANPLALACVSLGAVSLGILFLCGTMTVRPAKGERLSAPSVNQVATYSITGSLTAITLAAGARVDQMILPGTGTSATVGYYAVASTVAEVPLLVTALAARGMLHSIGSGRSLKEGLSEAKFYILTTVGVVIVIIVVADPVIPLIFGRDFTSSVLPARVLCLGVIGFLATNVGCAAIAGLGRPGRAATGPLVGLFSLIAFYAFIRGDVTSISAAWAWSFAQTLSGLIVVVTLASSRRWRSASDPSILDREAL